MTDEVRGSGLTLKASMLPMSVLELRTRDVESLRTTLHETVQQSPEFFQQAPVVLAVEKLAAPGEILAEVVALCREQGLLPLAIRGGDEQVRQQAWNLGLAWYPPQQEGRPSQASGRAAQQAASRPKSANVVHRGTVRGGQQVSATEGDLVVIGAVNAGAEVLAAGSVHVYGPLRGRALAGIHGNTEAGIFCQELHAELLAIAGSYKRLEDIEPSALGTPVQVRLHAEQIELLQLG